MTELYMTEDSKPTASMLGDSVIEAEIEKEVITEPIIQEVLESEILEPEHPDPFWCGSFDWSSSELWCSRKRGGIELCSSFHSRT